MDPNQKRFEDMLREICPNVYYQPPPNFKLKYPCIMYDQVGDVKGWAGDAGYIYTRQWMVTHITKDPLDNSPNKLALKPMCEFNRVYTVGGLKHTVYYIYY